MADSDTSSLVDLRSDSARSWVDRIWTGDPSGALSWVDRALLPGEWLFRTGVALRNQGYRRGWLESERVPIPVLSVGNLTVGGTGKTPLVRWLVEALLARGHHPAVVLRGYGNDEPQLHRTWTPEAGVFANPDRVEASMRAAAAGHDCVVLDDGFQHRRIQRDLDIVVLPAHPPHRMRLLPRGPYREPPSALARADVVVQVKKGREGGDTPSSRSTPDLDRWAPGALRATVEMDVTGWRRLGTGKPAHAVPDASSFLVVSGVGDPGGVERVVAGALPDAETEMWAFPDHHPYDSADCSAIQARAAGRAVVTTEKDAVKLERFAQQLPPTWVMELGPVAWTNQDGLLDRVLQTVGDPT